MTSRPIFVATHPRACSTAFERVFMTRRDILECAHEPFGDAFYYGPERLSERFENDEEARIKSGFSGVTYKDVLDGLVKSTPEGKRLFIKDITYYLFPPNGKPATIAPSLAKEGQNGTSKEAISNGITNGTTNGITYGAANGIQNDTAANGEFGVNSHGKGRLENPTVIPLDVLRQFHFTFLIRHPRRAIPSFYRCTVPPLDKVTGFSEFMPSEAGYDELRRLFDYLRNQGVVGPHKAGSDGGGGGAGARITVIDADDLLDKPAEVINAYCREVGIDYSPDMLRWEDEKNQEYAVKAFEKWNGFHNDVIGSTFLKPRTHGCKTATAESENKEWREKYGEEAQKVIRNCVEANIQDYEYLKSFTIKV